MTTTLRRALTAIGAVLAFTGGAAVLRLAEKLPVPTPAADPASRAKLHAALVQEEKAAEALRAADAKLRAKVALGTRRLHELTLAFDETQAKADNLAHRVALLAPARTPASGAVIEERGRAAAPPASSPTPPSPPPSPPPSSSPFTSSSAPSASPAPSAPQPQPVPSLPLQVQSVTGASQGAPWSSLGEGDGYGSRGGFEHEDGWHGGGWWEGDDE